MFINFFYVPSYESLELNVPLQFDSMSPSTLKNTGLHSKSVIHRAAGSCRHPASSQGLKSHSDLGSTSATWRSGVQNKTTGK